MECGGGLLHQTSGGDFVWCMKCIILKTLSVYVIFLNHFFKLPSKSVNRLIHNLIIKFKIGIAQSKRRHRSRQVQTLENFLCWGKVHSVSYKPSCCSASFFSFLWHQWPQRRQKLAAGRQTQLSRCWRELGGMEASSKGTVKLVLWSSYNQIKSLWGT